MTWQPGRGGVQVWDDDLFDDDPRHGTIAGYRAHMRAVGRPCMECADAWTLYCRQQAHVDGRACVDCGRPVTRRATRCKQCAGRCFGGLLDAANRSKDHQFTTHRGEP